MIAEKDKKKIQDISCKYHATRVLLFGSALCDAGESQDIDIAVEGIADKDFYTFYGELLCALSKPVDVVDLSRKTKFVELVLKEGAPLHG
ncbi:MAG: nucleotidyltransferase domain-containing protein [Deltaproteobacteria bacterium]|nr:nucleotidyltransferase domain-containing protein [Deltaproteobacteria bacterium]